MLPPTLVARLAAPSDAFPGGLVMSAEDRKDIPLMTCAALRGFSQMGVFHLRKLMGYLGCGGGFKKTPTELQLLERLIKHWIPDISKEDFEAAIKFRGKSVTDTHESVLARQEDLEMVSCILER